MIFKVRITLLKSFLKSKDHLSGVYMQWNVCVMYTNESRIPSKSKRIKDKSVETSTDVPLYDNSINIIT